MSKNPFAGNKAPPFGAKGETDAKKPTKGKKGGKKGKFPAFLKGKK